MATKKPVKGAKAAAKAAKPAKKVAATKATVAKKAASSKGSSVAKKATAKKADKKQKKAVAPPKKAAAKLTKPSAKATTGKVAKTAVKKLKEPVKKTTEADKKETKAVATKKETAAERKSKADVAVEKEPKATATKSASAKAAKPDPEKNSKPVVIPKTSTDKKVDYEPDFMKSVLDVPAAGPQGPTMRYSDAELQEFRDLIAKKLEAAKKELAYLQGLITRRDEMGGDETDNRYMTMEDGGMSMEREQLSQMASRQITFIDHLEKALMRIENKTYGICRVTGKLIDKARLRAVPHATLSMEAKLGITK
jgi:RNA polymerase-binding transcription factor DksA